ncbi:hypothetical protein [Herbaspirillum chlorophenolicum]|jgi:hypothetical protein|uniref:hypothetical protein n=1 Tax=Herbaspirillum chlorophenolicum TaxID=211589 RepID=UPI0012E17B31|nr:hypothetical protein [Herbaspirillum chlorophenolicum]
MSRPDLQMPGASSPWAVLQIPAMTPLTRGLLFLLPALPAAVVAAHPLFEMTLK